MPPTGRVGRFALGFLGGILLGVAALGLWFGVTGALAARDVLGLRADARAIERAVDERSYATAVSALPDAAAHASDLYARLASAPWSWAQQFPFVGPTVAAGATVAGATDQVLSQFDGWSRPLVSASAGGDIAVVVSTLAEVAPDLGETSAAAAQAAADVAAMETDGVLEPLRRPLQSVRRQFLGAVEPLAHGAAVARVLPELLGAQEPVRWLVVLSQPGEARGSGGGFYGAYAAVVVSQGSFAMESARANGPETAVAQDLSALPAEYRRLWGADAEYLWGFNLTRHHPYSASVVHAALDPDADYVVSLDPRAVAGLLALTGPVTVDGVTLDEGNAEQFFARDIYVRYPDSAAKDQVMLAFLQEAFGQLSSARLDPEALWLALGSPVSEGHVQVWSPQPEVQAALAASQLGGSVPDAGPWVTAAFNNSAGNKIDSYLASSLDYRVRGSCASGSVTGSLAATLTLQQIPPGLPPYISGRNDRPDAPYGTSSMLVHLYAPPGAVGSSFTIDGAPAMVTAGTERGHPVWGAKVELSPGQPVTVAATFTQPAFPGQVLTAVPQPMVQDTVVSVADGRSCAVG